MEDYGFETGMFACNVFVMLMSLATTSLAICEYAHKESENVALTIGISHFFPVKSGPQLQRYDPSVLTQSPLIHECVAFAHSSISYSQFIPS